jgi:uncharacterized protein YlxW (UPF0749 family)
MAETVGTGGTPRVPQTVGEKLAFSFPAILLTLVLAVGIGYVIVAVIDGQTREMVDKVNQRADALDKGLGDVKKDTQSLQASVKTLGEKTAKLESEKEQLAKKLDEVSGAFVKHAGDFAKYVDTQANLDTIQNKDISTTSKNLNAVETRVKYIDEKLKILDALAADVDSLKKETGTLKADGIVLRNDLTAVRNKADITDKDVTELSERTKLFQLRVLAARAREAADAARATDIKLLLQRLEDAEEK